MPNVGGRVVTREVAATHTMGARGRILADLVGWMLGMTFVALGGSKIRTTDRFVEQFAGWGLTERSIVPVGIIEVVLGLLVLNRGTRSVGAIATIAWMFAALGLHVRLGQWTALILPATLMTIAVAIWFGDRGADTGKRSPLLPQPLGDPPGRALPALHYVFALVGMSFFLRWAVGGVLFWCALPVLAIAHAQTISPDSVTTRVRMLLLYLLVLGVGVSGIWGFVGHVLMSDTVAQSIGWSPGSPFQRELGFYHLGIGIAGFACLWIRDRFWLALGLVWVVFLYGAAGVHVAEYVSRGNASVANWGFGMFFGDVIVPTALITLLIMYDRLGGWRTNEFIPGSTHQAR